MQYNSEDKTLERSYKIKWKHLISEYELIKKRSHSRYRFVGELFKAHGTNRQLFNKIYRRFSSSGNESELLPQKRGPKWCSRRTDLKIEEAVIVERTKGLNKYEICDILSRKNDGQRVISPSGVYKVIKRAGMNVLRQKEKEVKKKIIKENPGELGHIDCHYLDKNLIIGSSSKQLYLVCVIDSCSRIAWAEVIEDIKSLTVMFSTLRLFNALKKNYSITFSEIISDNGAEFSSRRNSFRHKRKKLVL